MIRNSIDEETTNVNIHSAEMTALLRCSYPNMSHDSISKCLVSSDGVNNTYQFIKHFNYPLLGRVISARAGFLLNESVRLLQARQYDSCISIGSGLSMLTYLISNKITREIAIFDCDVDEMLSERQKRISSVESLTNFKPQFSQNCSINIIDAYKKGTMLNELFPEIKKPLFILEGISYFLPKTVFSWLLDQIFHYDSKAVIFDYCHSAENSQCLDRLLNTLPDFLCKGDAIYPSTSLPINRLYQNFNQVKTYAMDEVDIILSEKNNETILLRDQNNYVPTKIVVAE